MRLFNPHRQNPITHDWKDDPQLVDVVEHNIAKVVEHRRKEEASKSLEDRAADALTKFSGSMWFVYIHACWFVIWIAINNGWTPIKRFDPFPYGLLTMIVSLEAIFLSTFVLISQNREAAISDKRADLDLQINLLAEHEITRIVKLVDAIADKLGCEEGDDPDLEELKKDIEPERVLEEIEEHNRTRQRRQPL